MRMDAKDLDAYINHNRNQPADEYQKMERKTTQRLSSAAKTLYLIYSENILKKGQLIKRYDPIQEV